MWEQVNKKMEGENSQKYKLLYSIEEPSDLHKLSIDELPLLCEEIRSFLLENLSVVPGHLGANFGVVELTVALHYTLNLPNDEIIWDVGHQAYVHKLLTGRRKDFKTLRQWGGISGFTHPFESRYDSFISGHASNSISAALGIAVGSKMKGEKKKVVAVIGDGAMTGGLAFEGLNNVSSQPNDLLIILNDNHIGIDPITGGLSKYLVRINTSKVYNDIRHKSYQSLRKLRLVDEGKKRSILMLNNSIKGLIADQSNLFEGFSIRYFGPTDGHDVVDLVRHINRIKDFTGPKLLHIKTIKGKGYKPAEDSAVVWHAPGKFDPITGERNVTLPHPDTPLKYQEIFGKTLLELADMDERIVGITPAMITGSSFNFMQERHPNRVFDVGIAEGHAVTFSAGLARKGMIPFCNIYSSFLQRGYDQVIHDVAMQKAPVILCLDRSGFVGEDGMTHHGVYDIAYLRTIPELTIMSPLNEKELRLMMYTAYKHHTEGPFIIRFPRGKGNCVDWHVPFEEIEIGKAQELIQGEGVVFITYGAIGNDALNAIKILEDKGYHPGLVNLRFVKPLDTKMLDRIAKQYPHVITVEDGSLAGGMGSAILEYYSDNHTEINVSRIGISDHFVKHGAVAQQHQYESMDEASMVRKALEIYQAL